jgi:hypothetical protein
MESSAADDARHRDLQDVYAVDLWRGSLWGPRAVAALFAWSLSDLERRKRASAQLEIHRVKTRKLLPCCVTNHSDSDGHRCGLRLAKQRCRQLDRFNELLTGDTSSPPLPAYSSVWLPRLGGAEPWSLACRLHLSHPPCYPSCRPSCWARSGPRWTPSFSVPVDANRKLTTF